MHIKHDIITTSPQYSNISDDHNLQPLPFANLKMTIINQDRYYRMGDETCKLISRNLPNLDQISTYIEHMKRTWLMVSTPTQQTKYKMESNSNPHLDKLNLVGILSNEALQIKMLTFMNHFVPSSSMLSPKIETSSMCFL